MNAYEYLNALRAALAVLPDEEIDSAMRYYEDYFLDAGDENAARVIESLGSPEQVAQDILNSYTGVARRARPSDPPPSGDPAAPRRRGISPWLLAVIVLLAIPIGIPLALVLLAGFAALCISLIGLAIGAAALCIVLPLALCVGGAALCGFSLFVLFHPASALMTFGAGLVCMACGVLLGALVVKLAVLFVPPIIRGIVAVLRWPLDKIRGART